MEIKLNKSNKQKYVTIPKESPLKEGDKVEISLKFGGVYHKKALDEYFENNKLRLDELRNKLDDNHDKFYGGPEWKFFKDELPIMLGLGEMERIFDEGVHFQTADDYDYSPFSDVDGGIFGDLYSFRAITQMLELRTNKKYNLDNPEVLTSNLKSLAKVKFMQSVEEGISNAYDREMNNICQEYNFMPAEVSDDFDNTYFDGKVYLVFIGMSLRSIEIRDYHQKEIIKLPNKQ